MARTTGDGRERVGVKGVGQRRVQSLFTTRRDTGTSRVWTWTRTSTRRVSVPLSRVIGSYLVRGLGTARRIRWKQGKCKRGYLGIPGSFRGYGKGLGLNPIPFGPQVRVKRIE